MNDINSKSSRISGSTSNSSRVNDTTSNSRSAQINDSTHYNLSDHIIICDFIDSRKNNISYDKKYIPRIILLLDKPRKLGEKLYERTISQNENRQYITIIIKFKNVIHFIKEVCDIIIKGVNIYG